MVVSETPVTDFPTDQHGQVIDVLLTVRRDAAAARRFFTQALETLKVVATEVVTDAAPVCPAVHDKLLPAAWHHVEQYANNRSRPIRPAPRVAAALTELGQAM